MKKVFIVSSVAFLVVLVFWGVYNFAFKDDSLKKKETEKSAQTKPVNSSDSKKIMSDVKIRDISNEAVISPIIRPEGNKILFYAALDGRVFSIDFDGTGKSVFSSTALAGLSKIIWSSDKKKVIAEFDGGARKSSYDYETKIGKSLNGALGNPVWSNLGDKLLYQFKNDKTNELSLADPDGSNWKKITGVESARIKIAPIPQTSLVSFWNYPTASEETALFGVGILGGEVKKIFGGKFGADYLWSSNGKRALVSFVESQNGGRISLGVMTQDGVNFRDLNIPTVVSKCVWSADGKTIFYALPGNAPEGVVMPDDYQNGKFNSNDTFWKVDIETGEKNRMIELEDLAKVGTALDAANLFLSDKEDILFFVNRHDSYLYRLDLAKK